MFSAFLVRFFSRNFTLRTLCATSSCCVAVKIGVKVVGVTKKYSVNRWLLGISVYKMLVV